MRSESVRTPIIGPSQWCESCCQLRPNNSYIAGGSSMNFPSTGFHHITVCSGKAQDDIDFFTQVLGQRLIKQTILFDGRFAHYHLYYANGHIDPGTVMTSFPYSRVQGRPGSGQVHSTAY